MNKIKTILASVSLLGLAACAGTTHETVITVPTTTIDAQLPAGVTMRDVKFEVLDLAKLKQLVAEAEKNGQSVVLVTLSAQGYQNLAVNLVELKRYIEQLQETVKYYRKNNADSAHVVEK